MRRSKFVRGGRNKSIKVNIKAEAASPALALIVEIMKEDGELDKIVSSDWLIFSENDLKCFPG